MTGEQAFKAFAGQFHQDIFFLHPDPAKAADTALGVVPRAALPALADYLKTVADGGDPVAVWNASSADVDFRSANRAEQFFQLVIERVRLRLS